MDRHPYRHVKIKCFHMISASLGATAQLTARALQQLPLAFRPSTRASYDRMWRDFLGFLVVTGLHLSEVNHFTCLAFMQFLAENNMSSANIGNYMAAIRANFIMLSLDTTPLRNEQIAMFHKSLKASIPFSPKLTCLIDIPMLQNMVKVAMALKDPEIYVALFTFCFFSFLMDKSQTCDVGPTAF